MKRIILDEATLAKLLLVTHPVELCDSNGHVWGQFIPVTEPTHYVGREPDITEEELRRREQKGGGRTLAEIMKDLEKRA